MWWRCLRDPRGYAVGAFCPLVVSPVADFVLGEGQSDSKTPMSVRTREQGYRGPFTGCAAAKGRDPGRPIPITKTSIRTWSPVWWGRTLISALSSEVADIYSQARLNVHSQQPMVGCLRAPPGDSWCSPGQAGGGGWGQGGLGDPAPDKWGWTLTSCGSVSLLRTPFHHYRGAISDSV